jgi:hypothetical protein
MPQLMIVTVLQFEQRILEEEELDATLYNDDESGEEVE